MTVYELIKKKRDKGELLDKELKYLVDGFVGEGVPDYQMSAFLMAVFFNGMTERETHAFTQAIVESGEIIDLSNIPGIKVDKHSSGGVADTVTLVVGPIVAAGEVPVAKISGRGLGHTGGTLDKLESIPGFKTNISKQEFIEIVKRIGISIIGQSQELVPADKKLYALRDVTATVDSIPLIAASIMSKKIACGADAIVLDVKTGSGAFMKDETSASKLAETMVNIGKRAGKKMLAFVTDMNQPLGLAVGNALEVQEAVEVLQGSGPIELRIVSLKIAGGMLWLGGKANSQAEGEKLAEKLIDSGAALAKFKEFIVAQHGNPKFCNDFSLLPQAKNKQSFRSQKTGYLAAINNEAIGLASVGLGAGRIVKNAPIDHAAGIKLFKRLGDKIEKGQELCEMYTSEVDKFSAAEELLSQAFIIQEQPSNISPLIYNILT